MMAVVVVLAVWSASLEERVAVARSGETIVLADGDHRGGTLEGLRFNKPVIIKAAHAEKAVIVEDRNIRQCLWIRRCKGLRFEGLVFYSRDLYPLHIDGEPLPTPDLSENITFDRCTFVGMGTSYCVKLSQAKRISFLNCVFLTPEKSKANDQNGGGLDAVAVDKLLIKDCIFDIRKRNTLTLMIKGGAKEVAVTGCTLNCPDTTSLHLAGSTRPDFRTRPNVRFELEDFVFSKNTVRFADTQGENLHGVWDSLGHARFEDNAFINVGQILFVAKRTFNDLDACKDITFRNNRLALRPEGLASPWNAIITTQYYTIPGDEKERRFLEKEEFKAEGNTITYIGAEPKLDNPVYLSEGFRLEKRVEE